MRSRFLESQLSLLTRIKHARMAYLADAFPSPDDDYWYTARSRAGIPGTTITEKAAPQVSAVMACVRVIAETVASLPYGVHRWLPNDRGKESAREHPVDDIIRRNPNDDQTAMEFWETMLVHCLTNGNAYARVFFRPGPRQVPRAMVPILPQTVTVERDRESGVKFYRIRVDGRPDEISLGDDILHIPGLGYDGLVGYSPIEMARRAIEMGQAAEIYAGQFFANGALPQSYATFPQTLSKDVREELKKWLKANHGGLTNAHNPGIFEQGGEIKSLNLNHRDMQFLELRRFQIEEIARIYRVPLHLVGDLSRSTNNNIEHQSLEFAMHTIRPWLVRIEQRVNKTLFGVREMDTYFSQFNMEGLLRGDSAGRSALYATLISHAVMTPNEARAKENLNWRQDGDRLFIQGAMVPVDMAGELSDPSPEPVSDPEDDKNPVKKTKKRPVVKP